MHSASQDNKTNWTVAVFCLLLAVAVAGSRFLVSFNLAPVGALAILAGARLRPRFAAYLLPYVVMAFTDWILYLTKGDQPFDPSVYLCYAMYVLIGHLLCRERSWWRPGVAGLLGATLFFLITNFHYWLSPDGVERYGRSVAGIIDCYVAAILFYRNTFLSDVGFSLVLFGTLEGVLQVVARRATENETAVTTVQ